MKLQMQTCTSARSSRLFRTVGGICATICAALGAPRVEAAGIPPYIVQGYVFDGNSSTSLAGPGTVSFSNGGASATATVSVVGPMVSISGTNDPPSGYFSQAYASLTYFLQITGPAGTVPVHVTAFGSTGPAYNGTLGGTYNAAFSVSSGAIYTIDKLVDQGTAPASFSVNGTYDFLADTLYRVQLQAFGVGNGTFFSTVDPMFTIAALNPNDYTLEFSPGIVNGPSAVPLPAALPLFATVLGGAGFLTWRRRKAATKAVA
jgi:hypothetical protein